MEDQKNKNLPPKIDAQKMEAQLQEEKKKEEAFNKKQKQKRWLLVGGIIGIIGIMVVAVVCFGLFVSKVTYSVAESIVNNIPEEEFHDSSYRLLNAPGEYVANEQLSIVEDLEDQDKIGLIKKGESFGVKILRMSIVKRSFGDSSILAGSFCVIKMEIMRRKMC